MSIVKFKKYIYLVLPVIVVLVIAIVTLGGERFKKTESNPVLNVISLEEQILAIGELATLQYDYKTLIQSSDNHKIKGWTIPLTQKSVIISIDGTMKIGVDMSEVSIDNSEEKIISITVPKSKILSHTLHEDTMAVLEEKSGLFNRISFEDWPTMAASEKQTMVDKVSESDMFIKAGNDAVRILQSLIAGVIPEGYIVEVYYEGN